MLLQFLNRASKTSMIWWNLLRARSISIQVVAQRSLRSCSNQMMSLASWKNSLGTKKCKSLKIWTRWLLLLMVKAKITLVDTRWTRLNIKKTKTFSMLMLSNNNCSSNKWLISLQLVDHRFNLFLTRTSFCNLIRFSQPSTKESPQILSKWFRYQIMILIWAQWEERRSMLSLANSNLSKSFTIRITTKWEHLKLTKIKERDRTNS